MFAVRGDHWSDNRFVKDEFAKLTEPDDQGPEMDRWTRASFKPQARQRQKASLFGTGIKNVKPKETKACNQYPETTRKITNILLKYKARKR